MRPFRPAWGLANPHAQTVAGKLLRPSIEVPLRRERIHTPDGDFVDLDHAGPPGELAGRPRVVVLHGLEGSASRRYMRTTYRAFLDRGLAPIGLNFRGCSGEPNLSARAYHSGETADLRHVLSLLRDRAATPLGLVGYSLGGNVVLKYLGESGEGAGVGAAAAVSVPFDLSAGSDQIERGPMGRIYTTYFVRSLRRKVELRADLMRQACDLDAVRRARTLREFDQAATAPLHGFADAEDYYARSSSAAFIAGIRTATLIVHAEDDPFLPRDRIPRPAMAANPAITPVITEHGGHVGFIEGSLLRPRFWLETTLGEWLAERLPVG